MLLASFLLLQRPQLSLKAGIVPKYLRRSFLDVLQLAFHTMQLIQQVLVSYFLFLSQALIVCHLCLQPLDLSLQGLHLILLIPQLLQYHIDLSFKVGVHTLKYLRSVYILLVDIQLLVQFAILSLHVFTVHLHPSVLVFELPVLEVEVKIVFPYLLQPLS